MKKIFSSIFRLNNPDVRSACTTMAEESAGFNQRMNRVEMQVWGHKAKLQFNFLLLLHSFCIDGGVLLTSLALA
jgi:hypothetical protein